MGYKQKVLAIVGVSSAVLMVLLVVFMTNYKGKSQSEEDIPAVGKQEVSEEMTGGQLGNDLSAFLYAKDFFNEDVQEKSEAQISNGTKLPKVSMMIVSVEKDLRIQIVDDAGRLVTGEKFVVEISGEGEYKDTDENGVLYIDGLTAGEYRVTLHDTQNYKASDETLKVKVKDKVEYVAIGDISVLIKTESDIDPTVEDTEVKEARLETETEEISTMKSDGETEFGIDVSKWNKEIDWEAVAEEGVKYAIIRCGYRGSSSGALVEDPYFEKNIIGAMDAGVKVGVYFFTQAINEVEAVEEASMVLELIKDYNMDYPVFIDTEGAGGNGRADFINTAQRTAVCRAFCETIEGAGYDAGVYASRNWYNKQLGVEELEKYVIWLAEYAEEPKYNRRYDMWQYTSSGELSGIEGRVDFNLSYRNEE